MRWNFLEGVTVAATVDLWNILVFFFIKHATFFQESKGGGGGIISFVFCLCLLQFCVAYTKCVATLWHDRIYLFVRESRAPVIWSSNPHMYALRTYFLYSIHFEKGSLVTTSCENDRMILRIPGCIWSMPELAWLGTARYTCKIPFIGTFTKLYIHQTSFHTFYTWCDLFFRQLKWRV